MKKTVKFISAICAIVMLLGILPVMSVSAADAATLVVTPSNEEVRAGKEFTVTVSLANNPGIGSIAFVMPIDVEKFEFVSADTKSSICPKLGMCDFGTTANAYKFNGLGDGLEDVTADGVLVTFTLKAKADAKLGSYTISANIDAQNTTGTFEGLVEVANGSASVKIIPNVPVSTITSAKVELGTDISVKYFVTLDEDHAGAQMKFTFNDEETIVDGVATGEANEYEYTFTGIAPQCMGDNIKAELIYNEAVVATKDGYSVLANCQNLLAKSAADLGLTDAQYAAMETLIADLLVYGAKAQLYNNYKTTALVDAGVTGATEFVKLTETVRKVWDYTDDYTALEDVDLKSAGVYFDYANSMYVKFTAPDMNDDTFRVKFNGEYYALSECELIDEATSTYKFTTDNISVLDYNTSYNIDLEWYDAEDEEDWVRIHRIRYSINAYVYAKQDTANAEMADLAKALYNYGVSAVAFLNA